MGGRQTNSQHCAGGCPQLRSEWEGELRPRKTLLDAKGNAGQLYEGISPHLSLRGVKRRSNPLQSWRLLRYARNDSLCPAGLNVCAKRSVQLN
jgi:hypothetical protein